MDERTRRIVIEWTRASDEERVTFPAVVQMLVNAGVERYHADLVKHDKTYYLPSGSYTIVPTHAVVELPAQSFVAADIEAAVRASQQQQIGYREFCRRIVGAGCAGYWVSITGKRAVYYGRSGETHVELFPQANS